jgi:large subunit ribosomal protein L15
MSLSLHTIKKTKATEKKRKRIGRGNASGTGTYSGKGLKGQKSRSGVTGLKRLGMKQVLLRTPKLRGFKSLKAKKQNVSLSELNEQFKDGDKIDATVLFEKKMINTPKIGVKVLGNGELELKKIQLIGITATTSAKEKIEKLGGKIV